MWKNIRVACLLIVLLIVAVNAYRDQNQDWNQPINILLHPINADGLPTTEKYIQQLQSDGFAEVKYYLEKICLRCQLLESNQYVFKNMFMLFSLTNLS